MHTFYNLCLVDFPLNEVRSLAYLRQSLQTTLVEHVFRRSACHLDAGQRIFALKELVCYLAVVEPRSVLECLNLQELGSVS
nr:unnamed protein product [Spirometra erinaceieuropaei]